MTTRVTRQQVDGLADIVSNMLGLSREPGEAFTGTALCRSCKMRGVDRENSYHKGCIVYIQGAYGGYSVRLRHADTGESDLGLGYVTLRECRTFLQGMRAALAELRD